jgi:hypothetical protein
MHGRQQAKFAKKSDPNEKFKRISSYSVIDSQIQVFGLSANVTQAMSRPKERLQDVDLKENSIVGMLFAFEGKRVLSQEIAIT